MLCGKYPNAVVRGSSMTLWRSRERRDGFGEPGRRRLAVDRGFACGKQRSARLSLLVAQHHVRAALGRGERRREPGRAAAPITSTSQCA